MTKSTPQGVLLDTKPLDLKRLPKAINGAQDRRGFVYALDLSNGMVKVGKTTRPRRRVAQHRAEGELHGYEISRLWVSAAHSGVQGSEAKLVAFSEANGVSVASRREYFEGLDFDAVVTFAKTLRYETFGGEDEEDEERVELEIRAMYNGAQANLATYMAASDNPETVEHAREFHVGQAFGRGFYHEWDTLPRGISKATPSEAIDRVRRLAAMTGLPPMRLLDLNWIDVIELTIVTMARQVGNELRQYALENDMHHLADPAWAHIEWPENSDEVPCCELFGPDACDHGDEPEDPDDEIDVGLRRLLDGV